MNRHLLDLYILKRKFEKEYWGPEVGPGDYTGAKNQPADTLPGRKTSS